MNTTALGGEHYTLLRQINVFNPNFVPELNEIFQGLAKINRFNGHTVYPYSVAQHSINCYMVAQSYHHIQDPTFLLQILLHDAAEAYIGDIVRPIKMALRRETNMFDDIEDKIMAALYRKLDIEEPTKANMELMKELDLRMAVTESDVLCTQFILPEVSRYPLNADYLLLFEMPYKQVQRLMKDFCIEALAEAKK